LEQKDKYLDF